MNAAVKDELGGCENTVSGPLRQLDSRPGQPSPAFGCFAQRQAGHASDRGLFLYSVRVREHHRCAIVEQKKIEIAQPMQRHNASLQLAKYRNSPKLSTFLRVRG
jgi:hypothetical protein